MSDINEYYISFQHDDDEAVRLQYNHEIFKDALGGRLVPIELDQSSPKTVLDSATADGMRI